MDVRYKSHWIAPAIVFSLLLFQSLPCPAAGADLSGDEVSELVSGNTVEAIHPAKGISIITFFATDGTFRQLMDNQPERGNWSVDANGQLCTYREGWGGECRLIAREGEVWKAYKIPRNLMKQRNHKRTFNRILPGNPYQL